MLAGLHPAASHLVGDTDRFRPKLECVDALKIGDDRIDHLIGECAE